MGMVGRFEHNEFDFPQVSIHAGLVCHDTSCIVAVTQKYVNSCKQRIEAFYAFPLYQDATVIACDVEFRNGKIVCAVKEKDFAEKEYKDAKGSGQQAALMREISGEHYDISVGNLDPEEEVTVIIKYLTTLKWDLEKKSYRFTFPTTIVPRYDNKTDFLEISSQFYTGYLMKGDDPRDPKQLQYSETAQRITLDVSVECVLNDVLRIIEPIESWNGTVLESNIVGNKGTVRFGKVKMDRDFIISIVPVKSGPCDYIMQEKYLDGSFTWKVQVDAQRFVKGNHDKQFEFIFVVDQSGSMQGAQIEHARHALNILINSIQQGNTFNVYGFGSSFYSFFKNSVEYNEANFRAAKEFSRKKVHADLGGTELNAVLQHIYGLKKRLGYERRIILLTDGEVWNIQELFDICKNDMETRVYTIGIGNGVSHLLVEGLARITGGNCEIVTENELIEEKCLCQLRFAMAEITEIEIEGKKFKIVPGSTFVKYHTVENKITGEHVQISIAGNDEPDFIFKVIDCENGNVAPLRLQAIKEKITELIEEHDMIQKSSERKEEAYKKILDLSTKYNVLCAYTAFVGILEGERGEGTTRTMVSPLSAGKYARAEPLCQRQSKKGARIQYSSPLCGAGGFGNLVMPHAVGRKVSCVFGGASRLSTPKPTKEKLKEEEGEDLEECFTMPGGHTATKKSSQSKIVTETSLIQAQNFDGSFGNFFSGIDVVVQDNFDKEEEGEELEECFTMPGGHTATKKSSQSKIVMETSLIQAQNFDGSFGNFFSGIDVVLQDNFDNITNLSDEIWYTILARLMIRRICSIEETEDIPMKWRAMYEKADAYLQKNGDPIKIREAIESAAILLNQFEFK